MVFRNKKSPIFRFLKLSKKTMETHKKLASLLLPLCGQFIDCISMEIRIQLQYTNNQEVFRWFFENRKKFTFFDFLYLTVKQWKLHKKLGIGYFLFAAKLLMVPRWNFVYRYSVARRDIFGVFLWFGTKKLIFRF